MAKVKVTQSFLMEGAIPALNYIASLKGVMDNWKIYHGVKKNMNRITVEHAEFSDSFQILKETYMTDKFIDEKTGNEMIRVPEDKQKEFEENFKEINDTVEIDFYEIDIERLLDVESNISVEKIKFIMGLIFIDKEEERLRKVLEDRQAKKTSETTMEVVSDEEATPELTEARQKFAQDLIDEGAVEPKVN